MPKAIVHYAGAMGIHRKNGRYTKILAGWAACCSGELAEKIREIGNHTYDKSLVTCAKCKKQIAAEDAGLAMKAEQAKPKNGDPGPRSLSNLFKL